MREVLTSVLVLGLLFATAACTEDTTRPDTEVVPLKIDNIQLSGVSLRSSDPLESGDIGLFRLAGDGYSGTSNNVKYTYSGGGWSAASGVTPIYLSKSAANLCAYYPYSSDADYSDGQVTLTSQRYDNTKDLCYQTGVTASSEAAASFTLEHAYAMITFTLTRSATYPGTCAISNLSLANAGLLTSNTLDMTSGTTGTYGSGTAGTVSVLPSIAGIASGSSEAVSVLMVPVTTSMSGDIQLSLTVDGRALSTTISTTTLPKLEAGKNYNITATINGASLTITSVTTTDWADVTAGTVNNAMLAEEANCYMLPLGETVYIPVSRVETAWTQINNSAYTLPTAWTAALLWTDNSYGVSPSGSIADISYNRDGKYIKVTAGVAEGNSVIALYDNDGTTILWSWHLWVTNYNPNLPSNGTTYNFNPDNPLDFMDRNLGATTTTQATLTTLGLHYQWGRKDPFPHADTIVQIESTRGFNMYNASGTLLTQGNPTGGSSINYVNVFATTEENKLINLVYAVHNPTTFLRRETSGYNDWYTLTDDRSYQDDNLWGGAILTTPGTKTVFDPCPPGWRVPPIVNGYSPWSIFGSNEVGVTVARTSIGDWNRGLMTTFFTAGYIPASGYIKGNTDGITNIYATVGSDGGILSGSINNQYGIMLRIFPLLVHPRNQSGRVHGFPVRCVKE